MKASDRDLIVYCYEHESRNKLTFDPTAEGFTWTQSATVRNPHGQEMLVVPAFVRANIVTANNDRERECYRFYDTPIGLLSELELKYWIAGGMDSTQNLVSSYASLFGDQLELPVQTVEEELQKLGFTIAQLQIVIGWLIRGRSVSFDLDNLRMSYTTAPYMFPIPLI